MSANVITVLNNIIGFMRCSVRIVEAVRWFLKTVHGGLRAQRGIHIVDGSLPVSPL